MTVAVIVLASLDVVLALVVLVAVRRPPSALVAARGACSSRSPAAHSTRWCSTRRSGSRRRRSSTLVPAYLLQVPLQYAQDSPLSDDVAVALPLLEAVEHAALRAGVPVDARIENGRTPTHALRRLWEVEDFDRIVAPAPATGRGGFTREEVTWFLTHAPTETMVPEARRLRRPLGVVGIRPAASPCTSVAA